MGELEKHVLRTKLAELVRYVAFLRAKLPAAAADLAADLERQLAILHAVQLSAQIVCDVALHVSSAESAGAPSDYRSAVEDLGRRGAIPSELATRLGALAGMRNLIVHGYERVDLEIVHAACRRGLGDLDAFTAAIAERYRL